MPRETEIIFVFTVNKNANISYTPGLFNHPSKIKLKRNFKENIREGHAALNSCALLCQNGVDRYHARKFFLPGTNLFEQNVAIIFHLPFSKGPSDFQEILNINGDLVSPLS